MDKKKVKSSRSILEAEMNDYYAEPIETLTLASYSLENKWAEQLSNILVILWERNERVDLEQIVLNVKR